MNYHYITSRALDRWRSAQLDLRFAKSDDEREDARRRMAYYGPLRTASLFQDCPRRQARDPLQRIIDKMIAKDRANGYRFEPFSRLPGVLAPRGRAEVERKALSPFTVNEENKPCLPTSAKAEGRDQ